MLIERHIVSFSFIKNYISSTFYFSIRVFSCGNNVVHILAQSVKMIIMNNWYVIMIHVLHLRHFKEQNDQLSMLNKMELNFNY